MEFLNQFLNHYLGKLLLSVGTLWLATVLVLGGTEPLPDGQSLEAPLKAPFDRIETEITIPSLSFSPDSLEGHNVVSVQKKRAERVYQGIEMTVPPPVISPPPPALPEPGPTLSGAWHLPPPPALKKPPESGEKPPAQTEK